MSGSEQCPHGNRKHINVQYTCQHIWDVCDECYNKNYCLHEDTCSGTRKRWECPHKAEITRENIFYSCGHIANICNKCYSDGNCVAPLNDGGRIRPIEMDENNRCSSYCAIL